MKRSSKIYLRTMAVFWMMVGLSGILNPASMDSFHSEIGLEESSSFSDHVWFHGGLDILSWAIILFAISFEKISRRMTYIIAISALGPTFASVYSVLFTPFWTNMFFISGLMAFLFFVWGIVIANSMKRVTPKII